MRFSWNRADDGVVTVYGTTSDGRVFDVADFWLQPMTDKLGMTRAAALDWQQQHAELLVTAHNKLFTSKDIQSLAVTGSVLTEEMETAGFAAIKEYEQWKADRKFPRPSLIAHIWQRMVEAA